jgi:hypothetical protein
LPYWQSFVSRRVPGRDGQLPLSVNVEGDLDQRLARSARRNVDHLEQAERRVTGGSPALALEWMDLDGRLFRISRRKGLVNETGSRVPLLISGVNLPPLVSMPTECRNRPRPQMPICAPSGG